MWYWTLGSFFWTPGSKFFWKQVVLIIEFGLKCRWLLLNVHDSLTLGKWLLRLSAAFPGSGRGCIRAVLGRLIAWILYFNLLAWSCHNAGLFIFNITSYIHWNIVKKIASRISWWDNLAPHTLVVHYISSQILGLFSLRLMFLPFYGPQGILHSCVWKFIWLL